MTPSRRSATVAAPLLFAAALAMAVDGCAPTQYPDPVAQMINRERDPAERLAAAKQAEVEKPNDSSRIEALHHLVWDRGHPEILRKYAIDQLIAHDEAAFKATATNRIVLIENPDVLRYLLDKSAERGWNDFAPAIVRSWARRINGVREEDRVEYAAMKRLRPDRPPAGAVYAVFADAALPADQRGAAWELLNRLSDREGLTKLLNGTATATPMVADLKRGLSELDILPTNREGLTWLMYLADPSRQARWTAAREVVGRLDAEQRRGLELRHLAPLLVMEPQRLGMNRQMLARRLTAKLEPREHFLLSPTFDAQAKDYPQQFYEWESKLVWADLATLDLFLDGLDDPGVASKVFAIADADLRDTTTEFGGMLTRQPAAGWELRDFPPRTRRHDRIYLAPPDLVESLYTGLAHVHFHAQEARNSQFAGPGRGDLEFAERLNFNNLVFILVDKDKINVDYYHHGGVVIDLGTVRRP